MRERFVNDLQTALATPLPVGATRCRLADESRLPPTGQFRMVVFDADPAAYEIVIGTVVADGIAVVRGQEGTAETDHGAGAGVNFAVTAGALDRFVQGPVPGTPGTVLTVAEGGETAWAARDYEHSQLGASAVWVVAHHLGRHPAVTVVDSGGTVVQGNVRYDDPDTLTLTFSAPFGGKAYLT